MYTPVVLKLSNFMSHENTVLRFKNGITTMIYGVNKDDEGADSNGAGKSAIVKGITIALLDVPGTSLNKEDYIRDGFKEATLDLSLLNKFENKTLRIERNLTKNGTNLKIWENEELNTQITSVREGNQRILDLIGISKDDILNYFIINQENSHSFFESTDGEQKKIVSRFTNSDLVDSAILAVDLDLKENERSLSELTDSLTKSESRIQTINESLVYEREQRSKDYDKKKERINQEISNKLLELDSLKKNYKQRLVDKSGLELRLEELGDISLCSVDSDKLKFESLSRNYDVVRKDTKEAVRLFNDLELKLSGVIECPKCNYKWLSADPDTNLDSLRNSLLDLDRLISDNKLKQERLEKKERVLENLILKKNQKREEIGNLSLEIQESGRALLRLEEKRKDCEEDIRSFRLRIEKLDAFSLNSERISELSNQVVKEDELIKEIRERMSSLIGEKEKLLFWKINFGVKGFKTYLVNKVLVSLEGYVNFHLKQFRTNLQVKINGYKKLKNGDISEKIHILVARDGENWKKYQRHSGGQRRRINVCGILTIHKLINMSSKSGGLDLLILDEFFEGLDSHGQGEILNILNQSEVTNLVISHNNNDIGASSQLVVEYEEGVSRLIV